MSGFMDRDVQWSSVVAKERFIDRKRAEKTAITSHHAMLARALLFGSSESVSSFPRRI